MAQNIFEEIKRVNDKGVEYWSARDLYKVLDYADYRNFLPVIEKAKEACKNSNQVIHNHFVGVHEMVLLGSGAERSIDTVHLSRYACYLIIQNSDPSKVVVAKGQTYFARQTHRQEETDNALEDHKRVALRGEVSKHNTSLAKSATSAGVKNFGKFQNFGYKGLYGGLDATDIHKHKKLSKSQKILDHMGSEELAANLFRATQADAKLRREGIHNEMEASTAHFYVGQKVRKIIQEIGGEMPEKLPTPDGIAKAQTRIKKKEKKLIDGKKK